MSDIEIEKEIQAKGLTAPRITPAHIEGTIASEHYFTAGQGVWADELQQCGTPVTNNASLNVLTFCVLILRNGYTVTGESACADPKNYDVELGRKIARSNALNKVWGLEGYLLKSKLAGTL